MAATKPKLDEAITRLSRNDATLTALGLEANGVGVAGAGRVMEAYAAKGKIRRIDGMGSMDEVYARMKEAIKK